MVRLGYWLGLVLCDPFDALTLTVEWQEEQQPIKNGSINPHMFFYKTERGRPEREMATKWKLQQ